MNSGVSVLVGKTLKEIKCKNNDEFVFICDDGTSYRMYNEYECWYDEWTGDISGCLQDLIGSPILEARESTHIDTSEGIDTDPMWTFYLFITFNGSVVIKRHGEANGHYSEGVDSEKISFKISFN